MTKSKRLLFYGLMAVLGYIFIKHVLIHLLVTFASFLLGAGILFALVFLLLSRDKEQRS